MHMIGAHSATQYQALTAYHYKQENNSHSIKSAYYVPSIHFNTLPVHFPQVVKQYLANGHSWNVKQVRLSMAKPSACP